MHAVWCCWRQVHLTGWVNETAAVIQGRTLLEYMIQTASASLCREVLVVLGANSEEILAGIEKTQASIVHNKDWEEGMASSIRCGLAALATNFSSIDGVIIYGLRSTICFH